MISAHMQFYRAAIFVVNLAAVVLGPTQLFGRSKQSSDFMDTDTNISEIMLSGIVRG